MWVRVWWLGTCVRIWGVASCIGAQRLPGASCSIPSPTKGNSRAALCVTVPGGAERETHPVLPFSGPSLSPFSGQRLHTCGALAETSRQREPPAAPVPGPRVAAAARRPRRRPADGLEGSGGGLRALALADGKREPPTPAPDI